MIVLWLEQTSSWVSANLALGCFKMQKQEAAAPKTNPVRSLVPIPTRVCVAFAHKRSWGRLLPKAQCSSVGRPRDLQNLWQRDRFCLDVGSHPTTLDKLGSWHLPRLIMNTCLQEH
eukprot:6461654-Amphidinium_carterae.1